MENKNFLQKIFTGRRGRKLREYLTAYTFIAPATILVFIFGIFPVGFALFVSLHRWKIKRGDMLGLANYVKAIGNLAYVLVFFLGLGALYGVYILIKRIIKMAKEKEESPWPCIFPGVIFSGVVFALLNWFYRALPQVLDISFLIRRLEDKTPAVFFQLLKDALRSETVLPAWRLFFWLLIAGLVVSGVVLRLWRNKRNLNYQSKFALLFTALGAGVGLLYYTFLQVNLAYAESIAEGVDPGIWPQVIMISGGVILLGLAWLLWRRAEKQDSTWRFILYLLAALVLLVGGWLLIGEIPEIVAQGDEDLWEGLKVTIFFSLGTVPFQLGIALFLSILLFQKLKGSNIFRILYFIPYVCLLYTSPSPRDRTRSRMPSSA